jgi:hypothetical protein
VRVSALVRNDCGRIMIARLYLGYVSRDGEGIAARDGEAA